MVDTKGVYAHIVGNGTDSENLSNAHTVDWNGNAWFAGNITVGTDNKRVLTEDDLDSITLEGDNIEVSSIILKSSDGSGKKFQLTVNDAGYLVATEIV